MQQDLHRYRNEATRLRCPAAHKPAGSARRRGTNKLRFPTTTTGGKFITELSPNKYDFPGIHDTPARQRDRRAELSCYPVNGAKTLGNSRACAINNASESGQFWRNERQDPSSRLRLAPYECRLTIVR